MSGDVRRAHDCVSEFDGAGWLLAVRCLEWSSGTLGNGLEMFSPAVALGKDSRFPHADSEVIEPEVMGKLDLSATVSLICCPDAVESAADCGGVPCLRAVRASGVRAPSIELGNSTSSAATLQVSVFDEIRCSVAPETVLSLSAALSDALRIVSCFVMDSVARCRVVAGGLASAKSVTEPRSDDPLCAAVGEDTDAI